VALEVRIVLEVFLVGHAAIVVQDVCRRQRHIIGRRARRGVDVKN
jgi:hypothetical protein